MANEKEKIFDLVSDTEVHMSIMNDCVSVIFDIACLPSTIKEVAEILLKGCRLLEETVVTCENNNKAIKDLLGDTEKEKMDIGMTSGEKQILKDEVMKDLKTDEKEISLRLQTGKTISKEKMIHIDLPIQNSYVEIYVSIMINLYKLSDNEFRYVNFSGLYPTINFYNVHLLTRLDIGMILES